MDAQSIVTVYITASATLLTAVIAGIVALRTNILSRRNDHKLAVLKVLLEAAYKEYEFRTTQDLAAAKESNTTAKIKSFTEYIIFYRELAELFSGETITDTALVESLKKNKVIIDAYYANREEQRPEYHKIK